MIDTDDIVGDNDDNENVSRDDDFDNDDILVMKNAVVYDDRC